QALRQRLIVALTKRGRAELESRHAAHALELWNRVLTIDPANVEVLSLIDRLSKRRRLTALSLGSAVVVLGAWGGWALLHTKPAERVAEAQTATEPAAAPAAVPVTVPVAAPEPRARVPEEPVAAPRPAVASVARTQPVRRAEPPVKKETPAAS